MATCNSDDIINIMIESILVSGFVLQVATFENYLSSVRVATPRRKLK